MAKVQIAFCISFVSIYLPSIALSQPAADESDFRLYSAAQLVVLNAAVQDSHGKNIAGLKAQDFKIFEDGQPQPIKQFAAEDSPLTLGLVVDTSGSMRTKQSEVLTAALAFINASNPLDEMFVIDFNDRPYWGLPKSVLFSSNARELKTALFGRKPEGKTALYDALMQASDRLSQGKWEKKAILLISDGGDNNSGHTFAETVAAVQKSGATVYTIGLYDPDDSEHDLGILNRLSRMSGGESFTPELSDIGSICLRIAQDIRASYTVAYTPPKTDEHEKPRKIKVTAWEPAKGKLNVRTRTSYVLGD